MPQTQQVPPIVRGAHYALMMETSTEDAGFFPAAATIVADIRQAKDGTLAGQLSTADSSLFRVNDHQLQIQAPAAVTSGLTGNGAVLTFTRTDQGEPEPIDITLRLPVASFLPGFVSSLLGWNQAQVVSDEPVALVRCAAIISANSVTILSNSPVPSSSVPGFSARAAALDARLVALGF